MEPIYLDHNATTPIAPCVAKAMHEVLLSGPANPSSLHSYGRKAKALLASARNQIASFLSASPSEIIFTSGGTEGLHLAVLGSKPKKHIITSKIEHAALFQLIEQLEINGTPVTYLPVGPEGHVLPADLAAAITSDTDLIALSAVNSETGVKNPLEELARIAQEASVRFIVDGVALLGKELFTIPDGVSAMVFSGHKIYGPTGVGFLYARKDAPLSPLFHGGGQESLRRSGTENLPGIVGLAKAVSLIDEYMPDATIRMQTLRCLLETDILTLVPSAFINGTGPRICNTSSITFSDLDAESLLIQLDMNGVSASMGSACMSGAVAPSRTLIEMGLTRIQARSAIRFSLGKDTTESEIKTVTHILSNLSKPIPTQ